MTSGLASPTSVRVGRFGTRISVERAAWIFVWSLVVIRVALSVYRISRPGLQADETLFVNAATLRIPGDFIQYQIAGIPILVSPYIGALKSWIYAPIFSIFGASALTVRLPVILITTAGLPLVYMAIRDLINRPVALLSVTLLSFDNSVFWLTRDDVGPNAIEFFLKCAALLCCARLVRERRVRWVVLLLLALTLGVFNKLNFIWTVNGVVAASVVVAVYYRRALRSAWAPVAVWAGGLAAIYAGFAAYYLGEGISSLNAVPHQGSLLSYTWPLFEQGTKQILSGTWFLDYALVSTNPRMPVVWILVALFVIGTATSLGVRRTRSLTITCLSLVTVLTAIQILSTTQATAGWHYIAIYPFVIIVAAYGAWSLAVLILRRRAWVAVAIALVGLGLVAYDTILTVRYFRDLQGEPRFSAWTPAIYSLSDYMRGVDGTVFVADWGIYNPLLALDPSRRYLDAEFTFVSPAPAPLAAARAQVAGVPGPKLIVTHAGSEQVFPTVNADLRRAEAGHLSLLRTVTGVDGRPVYLVYRYR